MPGEVSQTNIDFIQAMAANIPPASTITPKVAVMALLRAADYFGELAAPTGNLWDTRDASGNLVLGKFTYSTAAGLLPGTTLEQHGALEFHARDILGVLDDQYVVDRLDQVLVGRPISLMGYISGGTGERGQVSIQLNPELLYMPTAESDRIYDALTRCAYCLVKSGISPRKAVAFHAEINNRYGFSQARKEEYDLLKSVGVPEAELPLYKAPVYLTMPHVLPINEDLRTEDLIKNNLGYWAKL
ncbi:MAG: hypothetical protein JWP00_4339 [Chloroflexi bacterium]|jgi:hypothetical protein|nr:hypothetical protein [Chloroflexota bacterium]